MENFSFFEAFIGLLACVLGLLSVVVPAGKIFIRDVKKVFEELEEKRNPTIENKFNQEAVEEYLTTEEGEKIINKIITENNIDDEN